MDKPIHILELDDSDNKIPKMIVSSTKMPRKMESPKAIVMHWTAAPGQKMLDTTLPWMIYDKRESSYNFGITENAEMFCMVKPPQCAIHAGSVQYTRFATDYFGELVAPTYKHTQATPHLSSPNIAALGIVMAVLDKDGNISDKMYEELVRLTAYVMNRYTTGLYAISMAHPYRDGGITEEERAKLDGTTVRVGNIMRHSDLTDLKEQKCPLLFFKKPEIWHRFLLDVDKLSQKWKAEYTIRNPDWIVNGTKEQNKGKLEFLSAGYPTVETEVIKIKR